jgi:hypothetical protein
MEDGAGVTNGSVAESQSLSDNGDSMSNTVAVEVAAGDGEAMDTSPDTDTGLGLPNGSTDPLESAATPTSPSTNEAAPQEPSDNQVPPTIPSGDEVSQGDGLSCCDALNCT